MPVTRARQRPPSTRRSRTTRRLRTTPRTTKPRLKTPARPKTQVPRRRLARTRPPPLPPPRRPRACAASTRCPGSPSRAPNGPRCRTSFRAARCPTRLASTPVSEQGSPSTLSSASASGSHRVQQSPAPAVPSRGARSPSDAVAAGLFGLVEALVGALVEVLARAFSSLESRHAEAHRAPDIDLLVLDDHRLDDAPHLLGGLHRAL